MMDPASIAVFATFGFNLVATVGIIFTWLLFRKLRGDK
jgi:hypothetical protein